MDLAEQLQKLQALREQGVLSEEEFALAKKRVLEADGSAPAGSASVPASAPQSSLHQLRRSSRDRWIGGVCGGLGVMSGIPSWAWRILFVLALCLHGIGFLIYILLWIFVPLQSEPVAKTETG